MKKLMPGAGLSFQRGQRIFDQSTLDVRAAKRWPNATRMPFLLKQVAQATLITPTICATSSPNYMPWVSATVRSNPFKIIVPNAINAARLRSETRSIETLPSQGLLPAVWEDH